MKLKMGGKIKKNGKVVGEYSYSFISCSFSFCIDNSSNHFWKREELEQFLVNNGYEIE